MAVRDEIKEQQKKMTDMTFSQKLSYLFYYYKWQTIVGIIIFLFVSSTIYHYASMKPEALNCVVINASTFDSTSKALQEDFTAYSSINTKKYAIKIDTSYMMDFKNSQPIAYNNAERISNMLMEGTLDVIICPPDFAKEYEKEGYVEKMVDITQFDKFNSYDLYPDRGSQYFCFIKDRPHKDAADELYSFFTANE